jgi:hypothetical protein
VILTQRKCDICGKVEETGIWTGRGNHRLEWFRVTKRRFVDDAFEPFIDETNLDVCSTACLRKLADDTDECYPPDEKEGQK